jgi:ATP-dependent DNA ligase
LPPRFNGLGPPTGAVLAFASLLSRAYLQRMFKSLDFCLPTKATSVPDTPDWLHEVKYDGYRLRLERDGDRVRLITRHGCTAS